MSNDTEHSVYTYRHPHPAVTTDCVIFGFDGTELCVLLIERGIEPYKGRYAFPGGFMKIDETLEECARRELMEETSLKVNRLEQFGAFSAVDRDPRERIVSVAFLGLVEMSEVHGGDDAASAHWIPLDKMPSLAFDHDTILQAAVNCLKKRIFFEHISFDLLNQTFTFPQLQRLYELILGVHFDRRNFKRKFMQLGIIEEVSSLDAHNESAHLMADSEAVSQTSPFELEKKLMFANKVGRTPHFYCFNKERYDELKDDPSDFHLEF